VVWERVRGLNNRFSWWSISRRVFRRINCCLWRDERGAGLGNHSISALESDNLNRLVDCRFAAAVSPPLFVRIADRSTSLFTPLKSCVKS